MWQPCVYNLLKLVGRCNAVLVNRFSFTKVFSPHHTNMILVIRIHAIFYKNNETQIGQNLGTIWEQSRAEAPNINVSEKCFTWGPH